MSNKQVKNSTYDISPAGDRECAYENFFVPLIACDDGYYYKYDTNFNVTKNRKCRWYYSIGSSDLRILISPQKFNISRFEKAYAKWNNKHVVINDAIVNEQKRLIAKHGNLFCGCITLMVNQDGNIEYWVGSNSNLKRLGDTDTYTQGSGELDEIEAHRIFNKVEEKEIEHLQHLEELARIRLKRKQRIASIFIGAAERVIFANQPERKHRDNTTNIVVIYKINGRKYNFIYDNYHYYLAAVDSVVLEIDDAVAKQLI